jgi:DNA-directed RNA polymerase subunit RPC12/RpoP
MCVCYECGKEVEELIWKSRCAECVVKRLEFNLKENDDLRTEIDRLKNMLDLLGGDE